MPDVQPTAASFESHQVKVVPTSELRTQQCGSEVEWSTHRSLCHQPGNHSQDEDPKAVAWFSGQPALVLVSVTVHRHGVGHHCWLPLLAPLVWGPYLVVQMLPSFLSPHVGSFTFSVTWLRRVVRIRSWRGECHPVFCG